METESEYAQKSAITKGFIVGRAIDFGHQALDRQQQFDKPRPRGPSSRTCYCTAAPPAPYGYGAGPNTSVLGPRAAVVSLASPAPCRSSIQLHASSSSISMVTVMAGGRRPMRRKSQGQKGHLCFSQLESQTLNILLDGVFNSKFIK